MGQYLTIATAAAEYLNTTQVNNAIATALSPYSTTAQISSNYYNKTQIDSTVSGINATLGGLTTTTASLQT